MVWQMRQTFSLFSGWGISVSKNIHVLCCTIVVTLVWWYVVMLGVYYVLTEVEVFSAF